jgi:hypothetical protein
MQTKGEILEILQQRHRELRNKLPKLSRINSKSSENKKADFWRAFGAADALSEIIDELLLTE